MKINSSNPINAARELHSYIGWTQPTDFSMEEIASSLGIFVKNVPIDGSDGRILIKGDTAIISIDKEINHVGRRNFILAHEIGHFLLHKEAFKLYSDTYLTLSEWYQKGIQEKEANIFASEILMPEYNFRGKVKGKRLNLPLIAEVSEYFGTSILASFLRYVSIGDFPAMIVFMQDGIIRWKYSSQDFPFRYLQTNSNVPAWTVAGDFFSKGIIESKPEQVEAREWFPDDSQIRYLSQMKLWEQCYPVNKNGLVSCLWTS